MKVALRQIRTWARCFGIALMLFSIGNIHGQGVVYVIPSTSPVYSTSVPQNDSVNIDIIGDGTTDFVLTSAINDTVSFTAINSNQFLIQGGYVAALPYGASISSNSDYSWSSGQATLAASLGFDGPPGLGEIGNFAGLTNAFIGFDLLDNGTNYYGWIHLQTSLLDLSLYGTMVDWAYETSPDTPIEAGETNEPVSFIANINGANEAPPNRSSNSGTGTFTLESFVAGFVLTYHVELDGAFQPTGAGIYGPVYPNGISPYKIADLGNAQIIFTSPPPVIGLVPFASARAGINPSTPITILPPPSTLVYDGQINLSSKEVAELSQGRLYVNFTSSRFRQGELRGAILFATPVQFAATLSVLNGIPRHESTNHVEASFTLTGDNLAYEVAMDTNLIQSWVGICESSIPNGYAPVPITKLNTTFGAGIPVGGYPGTPGLPGQVLYTGEVTLTDEEVSLLESGRFYVRVLMDRFCNNETGGQILPGD